MLKNIFLDLDDTILNFTAGEAKALSQTLREAGIAYAIDQISDLIAGGVDGIHLYTMNNPDVARKIADSISSIRAV